jgi:hypothetical protein
MHTAQSIQFMLLYRLMLCCTKIDLASFTTVAAIAQGDAHNMYSHIFFEM